MPLLNYNLHGRRVDHRVCYKNIGKNSYDSQQHEPPERTGWQGPDPGQFVRKRSKWVYVPMTTDDTIRQQARRLLSAHGEDAPIQAAMQAQALLDRGDRAGSALWGRIGNMTNVLLSKTTHAATGDPGSRDPIRPVESVNETPTLSDLPSPSIKRWQFQHKALVVTAVRTGLIDVAEACARYRITIEEFISWKRLLDEHGLRGLRTTRLQEYRHPASRASGNSGHSEEAKAHRSGS